MDEGLPDAAARLRAGQLVAFPTETVYGLGANALNPAAVEAIFKAKGRPASNPVIVHVADFATARMLSADWTPLAETLAKQFWPGPLTLVVQAAPNVPSIVMAGGTTVGIRIPDHAGARALIQAAGCPIAAPSANRSEAISPTAARHVAASLGEWVDDLLILDGGECGVGIESTVVDATGESAVILRPGDIAHADISAVVQVGDLPSHSAGPVRSPGQAVRHYAPKCPVEIHTHQEQSDCQLSTDVNVWLLWIGENPPHHSRVIDLGADPKSVAMALYAALHQADDAGAARIVVSGLPAGPEWVAVTDRLRRASAV